MVPYGPVWFHMAPYGPICSCLLPYAPVCSHMVLYSPICPRMFRRNGFKWYKMGQNNLISTLSGDFGLRVFWILHAVRRCRRWASAWHNHGFFPQPGNIRKNSCELSYLCEKQIGNFQALLSKAFWKGVNSLSYCICLVLLEISTLGTGLSVGIAQYPCGGYWWHCTSYVNCSANFAFLMRNFWLLHP